MNEKDFSVLLDLSSQSLGSGAKALSMFLEGRKVEIQAVEVTVGNWDSLRKSMPPEFVYVTYEYTGDISSPAILVLKREDAAIIANLIMGGEGLGATELGDLELSALNEGLSQILSYSSTPLSSILNKKLGVSSTQLQLVTSSQIITPAQPFTKEKVVQITYQFNLNHLLSANIWQLMPETTADKFVGGLLAAEAKVPPAKEEVKPEVKAEEIPTPSPSVETTTAPPPPTQPKEVKVQPVQFPSLEAKEAFKEVGNIDLIMDVPLQISVELGRAKMSIKEVLEMGTGSIIELDKLDGEPVDILANGRLIARGEVVVIGETFGVRVIEITTPSERLGRIRD